MQAVTVRRATSQDAEGMARVHVASWRSAYRGLMPDLVLDALSIEERAAMWTRLLGGDEAEGVFVAESGVEGIVGFAAAGPARGEGWEGLGELYAIYLLESWQRRGLGGGLTAAAWERLRALDLEEAVIWVLEGNGVARSFYEGLGAVARWHKEEVVRGQPLPHVGYHLRLVP